MLLIYFSTDMIFIYCEDIERYRSNELRSLNELQENVERQMHEEIESLQQNLQKELVSIGSVVEHDEEGVPWLEWEKDIKAMEDLAKELQLRP